MDPNTTPEPVAVNAYDDDVPVYTESEMPNVLKKQGENLARYSGALHQAQSDYLARTVEHEDVRGKEGPVAAKRLEELIALNLPELIEAERKYGFLTDDVYKIADALVVQTRDAMPDFSPAEHALIAQRDAVIASDCDRLTLARLVVQFRYALVTSDRTAQFLYVKYLPDRLAKAGESWEAEASKQQLAYLRRMMRDAEKNLRNDRLSAIHDQAKALLIEAGKVNRQAGKRAMQARAQRAAFVGPSDIPW